MKTQIQHFYSASERITRLNETFMQFVKNGLTKHELEQLIRKRPNTYGRFSTWLEKLPNA